MIKLNYQFLKNEEEPKFFLDWHFFEDHFWTRYALTKPMWNPKKMKELKKMNENRRKRWVICFYFLGHSISITIQLKKVGLTRYGKFIDEESRVKSLEMMQERRQREAEEIQKKLLKNKNKITSKTHKQKYRIKRSTGVPRILVDKEDYRCEDALELWRVYGLKDYFTLNEVIKIWGDYSESMCAGWLIADKSSIERVFRVELEEIKDETDK